MTRSLLRSSHESTWLDPYDQPVKWRLEVVFVPVSDVGRAKSFYRDAVGFNEEPANSR
jgi:hypothetical protein